MEGLRIGISKIASETFVRRKKLNKEVVEFYRVARVDNTLMETLSAAQSTDDLARVAVREAGKLGFHFTEQEAKAASMDIASLCNSAVNDDELTDFELEMIAAGSGADCGKVGGTQG